MYGYMYEYTYGNLFDTFFFGIKKRVRVDSPRSHRRFREALFLAVPGEEGRIMKEGYEERM
jgi:hypothetical protein